jgi:hypothetical protein
VGGQGTRCRHRCVVAGTSGVSGHRAEETANSDRAHRHSVHMTRLLPQRSHILDLPVPWAVTRHRAVASKVGRTTLGAQIVRQSIIDISIIRR